MLYKAGETGNMEEGKLNNIDKKTAKIIKLKSIASKCKYYVKLCQEEA